MQFIICRTSNGASLCRRGCIAHALSVGHSQGLVGGKAYTCACYAAAQAHGEALVQPWDALCPAQAARTVTQKFSCRWELRLSAAG